MSAFPSGRIWQLVGTWRWLLRQRVRPPWPQKVLLLLKEHRLSTRVRGSNGGPGLWTLAKPCSFSASPLVCSPAPHLSNGNQLQFAPASFSLAVFCDCQNFTMRSGRSGFSPSSHPLLKNDFQRYPYFYLDNPLPENFSRHIVLFLSLKYILCFLLVCFPITLYPSVMLLESRSPEACNLSTWEGELGIFWSLEAPPSQRKEKNTGKESRGEERRGKA